jgi:5,10-methylenetetrahydromethanopterin reductase
MVQLSVGVSGGKPLTEYIALARQVEGFGFQGFSIFDDLMFKPAWPILFAVAPHTSRVRLGPSVTNPYLVHPAILAGNAALLDEATGGRAYFGIGRGAFLEFLQVEMPRPITAVRESIEIARRLWQGDRTPYHGRVFTATEDAFLQWKPLRVEMPIMVGTWGPKMARMAGGLADEVKAGSCWSVAFSRHLWEHISAGAVEAGRAQDACGLVLGPLTSISEDRQAAEQFARRTLVFYLPYLAPMPEFAGVEAEELERVRAAASAGDVDKAASLLSQHTLDNFALYGNAGDCIAQIERMVDQTAVSRIEFGMPHGPEGSAAAIKLLGEKVRPHFR